MRPSSSAAVLAMARPIQRLCSSSSSIYPALRLSRAVPLILCVLVCSGGLGHRVLVAAGTSSSSSGGDSKHNNMNSYNNIVGSFNVNATLDDHQPREEVVVVVATVDDRSDSQDTDTKVPVSNAGHYVPMWAVEIPGGIQVADDVARHHGFINHGRVSRGALWDFVAINSMTPLLF